MPIYEFKCNDCDNQFEQLCGLHWQGKVICPVCGKGNIDKLISQVSGVGRTSGTSCGSCSGKSCSSCK